MDDLSGESPGREVGCGDVFKGHCCIITLRYRTPSSHSKNSLSKSCSKGWVGLQGNTYTICAKKFRGLGLKRPESWIANWVYQLGIAAYSSEAWPRAFATPVCPVHISIYVHMYMYISLSMYIYIYIHIHICIIYTYIYIYMSTYNKSEGPL